ncbi:MAG TPA: hypothetical protein DCL66_15735 [Gammaproteobacteria bacterium]|nr:hypothetical protein [Gammaproteobacteria bacterium]
MMFIEQKTQQFPELFMKASRCFALALSLLLTPILCFGQQLAATTLTASAPSNDLVLELSQPHLQSPEKLLASFIQKFGAYNVKLPEALRVTGRQLQEADNHQSALVLLAKSWQLSRINEGFYSASQIPTLELIIYSEMELGNWQAVDDHYSYLELLHRRVFDKKDPRLELGLQKVSAWHVNALSLTSGKDRVHHLREAYHLFKDRLAMAEQNLDHSDPKFGYLHESIRITEQQLRLNSQMSRAIVLQQQRAGGGSLLADSF